MGKKKKKVTVGYRYYMDFQAGLGRGPIDEVTEIRIDDKTAWAGTEGELSYSRAIFIDKPDLFGGDDTGGEGGVQGRLEVLMGAEDQQPSGMLQNLINGVLNPTSSIWQRDPNITPTQNKGGKLIPGFRGLVTTVFSGLISCYSAYPKMWSYRVRRTARGWTDNSIWYPEKLKIILRNDNALISGISDAQAENLRQIHAMNPAHILIECATNKEWGNGNNVTLSDINVDSYRAAADALYNEGFGLCFRYNRQENLDNFVSQVLDHIGGAQYIDLETGKLTLKLIRNDYDADSLPVFTYDTGILNVQDDDSASASVAANEIVVNYHDPVLNEAGQVRVQNLASIQAYGVISSTVDYKALPTYDLAARVGQRDLEAGTSGLTRLKIRFDRRAGVLAPAAVFRVNLPDRDINNMVLRVGKIEEQEDESLLITAIQDVFGLPSTNYSTVQPPNDWTPPDRTALPVTDSMIMEMPYHALVSDLSGADLSVLPQTVGFIGVCAQAPSSLSINYLLQTRAQGGNYSDITTGDWTPFAILMEDIQFNDVVFKVALNSDFQALNIGAAAVVNSEIVRLSDVNSTTGEISVDRGCADTIPLNHTSGAMLWLYDEAESDGVQYAAGETVNARLLTNTTTAQLETNNAPQLTTMMQQRFARPYPPGNVRINGAQSREIQNGTAFVITWSHRDRLQQADQLFGHNEGNIGPEPGTVYVLRLYRGHAVLRTITATGTEYRYPDLVDEAGEPVYEEFDRVTLHSKRESLESLQGYILTVLGTTPPDLIPIDLTAAVLDTRMRFECDSSHTYLDTNGLVNYAQPNEWPLEYINGVAIGRHEPETSADNLFTRNDIAPYILGDSSQTATAGTVGFSADNRFKSYRYTIPTKQDGAGNNFNLIQRSVLCEAGKSYFYSVYLKVISADRSITDDMHSSIVRFYAASGYATEIEKVTLQIVGNGYYRIRLTFNQNIAGNAYLRLGIYYSYSDSYIFETGAVQLEEGAYSSSYIQTSGTVATRAAASVYMQTQGASGCRVHYSNGDIEEHTFIGGNEYQLPVSVHDWGLRYLQRIEYIK